MFRTIVLVAPAPLTTRRADRAGSPGSHGLYCNHGLIYFLVSLGLLVAKHGTHATTRQQQEKRGNGRVRISNRKSAEALCLEGCRATNDLLPDRSLPTSTYFSQAPPKPKPRGGKLALRAPPGPPPRLRIRKAEMT